MYNRDKLIWGTVLIGLGLVFLLENLLVFEFNWAVLRKMWPLIIIFFGVNLLLPKTLIGNVITGIVWIGALGLFVYMGTRPSEDQDFLTVETIKKEITLLDRPMRYEQSFFQNEDPEIESAKLKISGAALSYNIISPSSDYLFEARTENRYGNHRLSYKERNGLADLHFRLNRGSHFKDLIGDPKSNFANISLSSLPVWDFDADLGSANANFDLKPYKVRSMKVVYGSGAIHTSLGMPLFTSSLIEFEGGEGLLHLEIPKQAQCVIHFEQEIYSEDFGELDLPDFEKINSKTVQTHGFVDTKPFYSIYLKFTKNGSFKIDQIDN